MAVSSDAVPAGGAVRTQSARVETVVGASPARCYEIASDVAAYPEWAHGISAVEILEVDAEGRVDTARFVAEAVGRRTRYVLRYDYGGAPGRLSWSQLSGDLTNRVDGTYTFAPSVESPGDTDVSYELDIDLAVPLPGFVKRRAEAKIVEAALTRFRERAEKLSEDFS